MKIIEAAKAHPYVSVGVAVAAVGIVIFATSGGGGEEQGYSGDSVSAGVSLQQFHDQMAANTAAIGADLQKTLGAQGAAVTIEKMRTDAAFDIASLQAGLGYAQIDAGKQVSTAQIAASEKAVYEETKRQQISSSQAIEQQRLMTDVIRGQTQAQRDVAIQSMKPRGVFSFLFG